ncbi:MAG: transcriptional regulator [Ignavibacteria bacterium RIFOXYB2_FULL_35_12]|nr:MAG: transcriptional regulator [Ignavibacteria bacterium GWF2_35_20]OGU78598.1 MAG: transcriptional regulator [Ignavibacteria bacterium RIFOXYA2_FULL_35_9]OGU88305.1 MAG: transcriptional regulator [Ignavibacteria bacterium RIFOXYC12_FULL_35_11]OGU91626.1 MAG: transcriptional regulator [Ignavibacteria bacterium RIFOXYA12_FULL_35_25]OGU97832.1 MAG: transcriptional regulator [Ignavibacteria bacterium RIFOXYB12_FULL_35_14]OGV00040.1 MAG: transcriptional regulator [Ignavibacteria bacterium RIFOX
MKVPLLDLKPQYKSLKKELDETLIRVAESQYFILGPEVDKMEKSFCNYLGSKYALGISSGTDALLIALMAIDIKPGDEVIVPTFSFFATAGVVSRLNAIPVLVDSDPVTFNIDPVEVEKKITSRTKAIIPVHLFGQSCYMDQIMVIARKNNIKVIEDAAQAIGVQYKDGRYVGTIGDIGCFSFFPSKNLGCFGDGGLVTTNDPHLGERLRILRVHGGEPKYYHKVIGGNFRLDALQAAILSVKLPHLDSWSEKRRKNAETYTKLFITKGLAAEEGKTKFDNKNKVLLPKAVYKDKVDSVRNYHIYNQFIIRVEKRDELRKYLAEKEIGTEIYYPVPFHMQECFAYLGNKPGDFPFAEQAANTSIALPIYPELSIEQLTFVVDTITEFIKNN